MPKKKKKQDNLKKQISKIEKEIRKLDIKFPEAKKVNRTKETKIDLKKLEELKFEPPLEQKPNKNQEEDKIIDFPAPIVNPERAKREFTPLEQTAIEAPTTDSANNSENKNLTAYASTTSAYMAGNGTYISNANYNSSRGADYSNKSINDAQRKFDAPMFATQRQQQVGDNRGVIRQSRDQESFSQEERARISSQYDIQQNETRQHGHIKGKTDNF